MSNSGNNSREVIDLRQELIDFWLSIMHDVRVEIVERMKASELLSKYILGDGKSISRRRDTDRPSTTEILKLLDDLPSDGED